MTNDGQIVRHQSQFTRSLRSSTISPQHVAMTMRAYYLSFFYLTKLTRCYSKYTCSHRTCICLILLPSLGRVNPCRLARPLVLQRSTAIGRTSYGNPTSPHRPIHPTLSLPVNLPSLELWAVSNLAVTCQINSLGFRTAGYNHRRII